MGYWPSVSSRWLDIGQVVFLCAYGHLRQSRTDKHAKNKTERGLLMSGHLGLANLDHKRFIFNDFLARHCG